MEGQLILDRYKRINSAGCGGSGQVDICWDTRIQRRVAIKRIPLSTQGPLSGDGTPGLAEARTAALLKHPAIVNLIDFEVEGDDALIIMEAVEGPSLSDIIDSVEQGDLDIDIIATVSEAMASALDYAHENQVLHLDIKPDNILIDTSGRPKVSDFGIAELADAQGFRQACGGTIGYMPPEQICGEELDQRCDLFSFAVCIYEMLTGVNPFIADDIDASLMKIEAFTFEPPSNYRQDTAYELDDVLLTAMQPSREDRYETVVDFMEELRPYLGDAVQGQRKLRKGIQADMDEGGEDADCTNNNKYDDSFQPEQNIWSKFSPTVKKIAGRCYAAVLSWCVASYALTLFGHLQTDVAMLGGVAAAIIAALYPSIGAACALCTLAAAFIYLPQIPTLVGLLLLIFTILWWIFIARDNIATSNITLIAVPFGLIYGTPFVPLIAGYTLRPKQAIGTSLMAAMILMSLSLATGSPSILHFNFNIIQNSDPFTLLTSAWGNPVVWICYVSWPIAALLMSLCCGTNRKLLCILGSLLATAVLFSTQLLVQWLQADALTLPPVTWCLAHLLSFMCIIAICVVGIVPRTRMEG